MCSCALRSVSLFNVLPFRCASSLTVIGCFPAGGCGMDEGKKLKAPGQCRQPFARLEGASLHAASCTLPGGKLRGCRLQAARGHAWPNNAINRNSGIAKQKQTLANNYFNRFVVY